MKPYVIGVLLLILISGCTQQPTGGVVIEDVSEEKPEEKPTEQPSEPIVEKETNITPTIPEEENITVEEPEEKISVKVVEIKDLKLNPKELKIKVGDTVVWKHADRFADRPDIRHQLAQFYNEFRSPVLYYGDSFNHTFTKAGEYGYIDVIYKEKNELRGKIIVE